MPESVTDRPTRSHEYIFLLSKSAKYYYDHEAIKEPALYDVDGTGTAARKVRQSADNKSMPTRNVNGIRPAGFKDAEKMNGKHSDKKRGHSRRHNGFHDRWDNMSHEEQCTGMKNKRDVWTVSPAQFPEAHFATFPEQLITPCILAGCPKDGIVLDPFMGAGTTAIVAKSHDRNFIGFELNPEYIKIAENRLKQEFGMFYETKTA
jgi:DNA modification methylase